MCKKCAKIVWESHVRKKHVGKMCGKTCGVEGMSHQSEISHSLIFKTNNHFRKSIILIDTICLFVCPFVRVCLMM